MDRIERDRERDRERLHARERDMLHYDINDDDLLNERNYGPADYGGGGGGGGSDRGGGMVRGDSRDMRDLRDPVSGSGMRERGMGLGLGASSSSSSSAPHARAQHTLGGDILDHGELLRERDRDRELNRGYAVQGGPRQLVAAPTSQTVGRRGMGDRDRDRDDYSPHRGGGNNRRDDGDADELPGASPPRVLVRGRTVEEEEEEEEEEPVPDSVAEALDEEKLVPDSDEDDGFEYDEFY
uniref:Uncharacterized protein n=1 Tax=Anopheles maculatus TaxID=74869 RepID=A0A182SRU6_9DIPT